MYGYWILVNMTIFLLHGMPSRLLSNPYANEGGGIPEGYNFYIDTDVDVNTGEVHALYEGSYLEDMEWLNLGWAIGCSLCREDHLELGPRCEFAPPSVWMPDEDYAQGVHPF